MSTLCKLNIIYLLLYFKVGELNTKSIISTRKDSEKFDNTNDDDVISLNETQIFNLNNQYQRLSIDERLSTDVSLEQSIMKADIFEKTTVAIKTEILNNYLEEDLLTTTATTENDEYTFSQEDMEMLVKDFSTATVTTEPDVNNFSNEGFEILTVTTERDGDFKLFSKDLLSTTVKTKPDNNNFSNKDLEFSDTATDPDDNTFSDEYLELLFLKYNNNDHNSCMLDGIKKALLWWTYFNGTLKNDKLNSTDFENIPYLDLSYRNISQDEELYKEVLSQDISDIKAFSAAYNNLTSVPLHTLEYIGSSLKLLTLKGNQFVAQTETVILQRFNNEKMSKDNNPNNHCNPPQANPRSDNFTRTDKGLFKKEEGIAWATFPYLPQLLELDISNCQIEFVTKRAFKNLTNLKRLYLAHNKMLTIPFDTFAHVQSLEYLDLSFIKVVDYNFQESISVDTAFSFINGMHIEQMTLAFIPKLVYLDLSHTKLTRTSAVAFTHLGPRLKFLSLCYTAFPIIGNVLFRNTPLEGLDISGNLLAAYSIPNDAFEGISNSLKYLYFERANLKDLNWLKYLHNLHFLGLACNNIHTLQLKTFKKLSHLRILDLSSNQVGNWFQQVFLYNQNLRVLSLRRNNLNIITSEMLKDFSTLDYLSLGDNNFICDCLLRDITEQSVINNRMAKCSRNDNYKSITETVTNSKLYIGLGNLNISSLLWKQHLKQLKSNNWNFAESKNSRSPVKMRFTRNYPQKCSSISGKKTTIRSEALNGTTLNFRLLDYEEEHYWCFNGTEKLNFVQLDCQQPNFIQDIAQQLNTLTNLIIICISSLLGLCLIGFLIYWKRWHIHYYYSSLKTASLMSVSVQENIKAFTDLDPNMLYDIFISYCEHDRDWILQELIPNVEENADISICLHERDFQVGVTILDNIVSCMERSRSLMLIISSNFLLSHWCQFEMHLAQHRIFDVTKEHLILVFLEDIPRNKRPKHLQYLMDIKTYIKWPGGKDKKGIRLEERKLFWKRLKRTLASIGLNPSESRA